MSSHRTGAPRLVEWTGERCVPWTGEVQVVYEHYHRYLWARSLVEGCRVLDLGSGEGYGAALLAGSAAKVMGIDIDEASVEHSRLHYAGDNLAFEVASATDLDPFPEASFDVVVAFEVIEHLTDQEKVLSEVARVLTPTGVLIISTPDRIAYSEETGNSNPFHERELTQEEFTDLLGRHFDSLALFGQRVASGSRIVAIESGSGNGHLALEITPTDEGWEETEPTRPMYMVAIASNGALPTMPAASTLSDPSLSLLREAEGRASRAEGRASRAEGALSEASAENAELRGRLTTTSRDLDDERSRRTKLVSELTTIRRELDQQRRQGAETEAQLARVHGSVTWQLFQRARARLYGLIGEETLAGRVFSASLRLLGRVTGQAAPTAAPVRSWLPLALPRFALPTVSIVIAVHAGAEDTERCLRSILSATDDVSYEVIVVDDTADEDTKRLLEVVDGVRLIVNERNRGFLESVNRGAAEAQGRYLVLLNNDTEVQPGWLSSLLTRAESAPDVGAVTPKLIYPDGTLQEAGGIVWSDGTPWNYGRGGDAGAPEYNYAREVDYGSAAALLVSVELWRAAGGFDERYSPAYFEDTDLCFAARALGWRVLYEPRSVVIHSEGGTMGTDLSAGLKRNQVLNQPKFAAKWREALRDQPSDPDFERARLASDRSPGPHVLVIDHRVPTPDQDAGSLRMFGMLHSLRELGCGVTFVPDDFAAREPYTAQLQAIGVEVLYGPVTLSQHLASLRPRLALCLASRPYVAARYMHLLRQHAPDALLAYDTVDLHSLREMRRAELCDGDRRVAEGYRELERALGRSADVTLAVSEEEREHLADLLPEATIEVVPLANVVAEDVPGPEERSGLLFLGNFEHLPNVDAAIALARDVLPLVWHDLDEVTVTLVGPNAPAAVEELASDRVTVAGWVEDIGPLLRDSIAMVAPLTYGAGMKGKVTQSLAAGLPVVTTPIGAEGLDVNGEHELLIGDGPEELAERIVRLCRDPVTWRSLSANGQELVARTCSPAVQKDALRRLLERAEAQRSATN